MVAVSILIPAAERSLTMAVLALRSAGARSFALAQSKIVNVDAFQWQWRFTYLRHDVTIVGTPGNPPTLVLPAGETTRIVLRADDVVHAFYVSDFLFQRQAIPGVVNTFDFTVPKPGRWPGQCSLYCGLDHTSMTFTVQALSPAAFNQWLSDHSLSGAGT